MLGLAGYTHRAGCEHEWKNTKQNKSQFGFGAGHLEGHYIDEKNQMREYQQCSCRIVTLTISLGGQVKPAVESVSLSLRKGDRNLGIMKCCLEPCDYVRSSMEEKQLIVPRLHIELHWWSEQFWEVMEMKRNQQRKLSRMSC